MSTPPRQFFDEFVRRAVEEFRAKPHDHYLAMVAITFANVMAERMWHHYEATDRLYGATDESQYRDALTAGECSDFGLVRDVADGFKHFVLTRRAKTRRVSSATQTGAGKVTWVNDKGEEITFVNDKGEEITFVGAVTVRLDDGTLRPLLPLLEEVVKMWDRLSLE